MQGGKQEDAARREREQQLQDLERELRAAQRRQQQNDGIKIETRLSNALVEAEEDADDQ